MKARIIRATKIRLNNGFTLLELLIAISIFAVLATMVYSTFNAVLSKTDSIKQETAVNEMAATCFSRISMDLQALYVEQYPLYKPPDYDDDPDPYRFVGETDYTGGEQFPRLRFVSTEHLPMSGPEDGASVDDKAIQPALSVIEYHVDKAGDEESYSGYVLKRADNPWPYDDSGLESDPEKDPVLLTGIKELEFIYLDKEGNEFETWDSESDNVDYATPHAVHVSMKISIEKREHQFSTRIVLPVYREPLKRVKQ